jgi:fructosamine-3-kinase
MSLSDPLRQALSDVLGAPVQQAQSVGGGCIAHATRIEVDGASYFLKYGRGDVARTFPAEAAGLEALRGAEHPLAVPDVLAVEPETDARSGFLLMDWIAQGSKGEDFWDHFGEGLAALHRHTAERYGFDRDNFIGSTPQENDWVDTWPAFFRARRLAPQVTLARQRGRWQERWDASLDALYNRLDELLPHDPPASILHGDLWGGNYLVTDDGRAALIDPAAYYGHREADLAMTELFGGYQSHFYEAYRAAWPLEPSYTERRAVYNLYHLLNHLNLFGSGYAGQVASVLRRFGG